MRNLLKHALLLGITIPVSLIGYRIATGAVGVEGQAASRTLSDGMDMALGTSDSNLSELALLKRDLYWVELKYVDSQRVDAGAMFDAALDNVERHVAEVLFEHEPGGRRLHVSVGAYSTVLLVDPITSLDDLWDQLVPVARVLDQHLDQDVDRARVEYLFINGAFSTLDPHTLHMPPDMAKDMEVDNDGEFGGLGIEISVRDGRLTVTAPLDGTPASKAGIQAGDRIVRIEDESTINMDLTDAVSKLRGRVGTPVTISVMRQGFTTPRKFTIVRDTIQIKPVEGELLEGNVGYVRINAFHRGVQQGVDEQLTRFHREARTGLTGLVIDLRGNPGGFLNQAVAVSDRFLADGVIVSTVEAGGDQRNESRASARGAETEYPIVVLVDGSSASASEIVAGALRNQDRAVIIGERTFGKGSVQHLYNQPDASKLKLTVAQYLTPGDKSIQSVGIPPDIQLHPSVVEPATESGSPRVSLYWREWVQREADEDNHLEGGQDDGHEPAYQVRFLLEDAGEDTSPQADWQVDFARRVLLAASGPRTADVLHAAAPVVRDAADRQQATIAQAFSKVGVDWSRGEADPAPRLEVEVDLGPDGLLVAGEPEEVGVTVHNRGDRPVYQLSAVTESDNLGLDSREFYFGMVPPGQSRTYVQRVQLPVGYGDDLSAMELRFRDPAGDVLFTHTDVVKTRGQALPSFAYTVTLKDDGTAGSSGDGDGAPDVGEVVALEVTVENVGEGPSRSASVRLKNRSGHALDLRSGVIELGEPRTATGETCVVDTEGCGMWLDPGSSQTGHMLVEVRGPDTEAPWKLELQLGDSEAYDYASTVRAGFGDFYGNRETIELRPDVPLDARQRRPPTIEISRAPASRTDDAHAVLSGAARDETGVRDVIVFAGEEKVFYRGGEADTRTLPLSVDTTLKPGANLLVVLVRDQDHLTATAALSVWLDPPEAEARVLTVDPAGGPPGSAR